MESFFVEFLFEEEPVIAEIKPCCQEDNVFYYDVSINNNFLFTITPNKGDYGFGWRVALMNSDKQADPKLADIIGEQIENYLLDS